MTFAPLKGPHNIVTVDAAFTETGDRFGVAVCAHESGPWNDSTKTREQSIVRVYETHGWRADRSPRDMALRLKREVCDRFGVTRVIADQHEASSWKQLASDVGLKVHVEPWTSGDRIDEDWLLGDREHMSKSQRYRSVRAAMLNGRVRIPNDAQLLQELRSVYSELTPAGNEVIRIKRTATGHGDRVTALVMGVSIALARKPVDMLHRWDEAEFHRQYLAWCATWPPGQWGCSTTPDPIFAGPRGITDYRTFRLRYPAPPRLPTKEIP